MSIPPADVPALKSQFLTTKNAAAFLAANDRTLERWRGEGVGPTYVKLGRLVRYRVADLEAWAEANLVQASP